MGNNSSKTIFTGIDFSTMKPHNNPSCKKDYEREHYDDSACFPETAFSFRGGFFRPMECPICAEGFDNDEHAACTLACGHSVCCRHANTLKSCPVCRKKVQRDRTLQKSMALSEASAALEAASVGTFQDVNKVSLALEESINFAIECPICWNMYDNGTHAPCTLPSCGHSFCARHGPDFKTQCCPICRDPFPRHSSLKKSRTLAIASVKLQHHLAKFSILKERETLSKGNANSSTTPQECFAIPVKPVKAY